MTPCSMSMTYRPQLCWLAGCLLLLAVSFHSGTSLAQAPATAVEAPLTTTADTAVEDAATALESNDFNWYDAETDSLRRVRIPATRTSNWNGPNLGGGGWGDSLGQFLMWTGVVLGLAVLAIALLMAYLRSENRDIEVVRGAATARSQAARMEALPFAVEEPTGDLLATARRHAERGDFNKAIIYLYSHLLMELDQHRWIFLTEGTTNRQYLRALAREHRLREIFELSMVAFEEAFFGHHQLSGARYEACAMLLPEFDAIVTRRQA